VAIFEQNIFKDSANLRWSCLLNVFTILLEQKNTKLELSVLVSGLSQARVFSPEEKIKKLQRSATPDFEYFQGTEMRKQHWKM
jgi:hypothetical protein